jgi:hypothetical protein
MLHLVSITTNNKNKKCFNWILGTWFLLFSYPKKEEEQNETYVLLSNKKNKQDMSLRFNIFSLMVWLDKYLLIVQATVNLDNQLKEYFNNIYIFIKNNATLTFTFL